MKKLLFTVLFIVVFAFPAFAQMKMEHGGGHGKMMGMGDMDMMGCDMMCMEHAHHMGLTDDQIAKMKPLHREMQKKQIRFKADEKLAQIELQEIMEVKDFDLAKAEDALKKIGNMKTAHHLEMLKTMKDVRSLLTNDQFKRMNKMCTMGMDKKKDSKMKMRKLIKKNSTPQQPAAEQQSKPQTDDTEHKH